ncbi:MAG: aminoglycoside phosphotransferase family protein [Flavobacteriales bacterium]
MDLKHLLSSIWGLSVTEVKPIDVGLINHTWLVRTPSHNFILQQINTSVFKNPMLLQDQLQQLSQKIMLERLVALEFIEIEGRTCFEYEQHFFRLQRAISPSISLSQLDENIACLAASALLEFHVALQKVNIEHWSAPIKNFLNPNFRVGAYEVAKQNANQIQLVTASREIRSLEQQMQLIHAWQELLDTEPKVLIHADPKLSNYLFATNAKTVRSLIDWDTIQFGSPYYDYADMIRSFCSLGEEVNTKKGLFKASVFEALLTTFRVDETKLFGAVQGVILVQAMRFLTDFLEGNHYYKVKDELHNLRRCQNQLQLVTELQRYWATTRRPIQ